MPKLSINQPRAKYFLTISELAKELGIASSAIRYWEEQFPSLRPKTIDARSGRRRYTQEEANKVRRVHYLLKEQKMTLDGVRKHLEYSRLQPNESINIIDTLVDLQNQLKAIYSQLEQFTDKGE